MPLRWLPKRKTKPADAPKVVRKKLGNGGVRMISRGDKWKRSKLEYYSDSGVHEISKEMEEFAKNHKNVLWKAHNFIQENLLAFRKNKRGFSLVDPVTKIRFTVDYNGKYAGRTGIASLRADYAGFSFFVRIIKSIPSGQNKGNAAPFVEASRRNAIAYERLNTFLASENNTILGVGVDLLKPHLIFHDKKSNLTFRVSDFYFADEVKLISDLPFWSMKKRRLSKVLETLAEKVKLSGVRDIHTWNAFYNERTGRILVFDPQFLLGQN